MVRIHPFRGIIFNQARIKNLSRVVAPPYDVIRPEEQENLYRRSPYNIVRLILSREPCPYESAASLFEQWQKEEILVRNDAPAIFFMSHRFKLKEGVEKERQGFFALTRIEDSSAEAIHPHERTLDGPREDRSRIILACNANLSPIFSLYSEPRQTINTMLVEHVRGVPPLMQVEDYEEGTCRLWPITDREMIRLVQQQMEGQSLFIADGHHRYEAAKSYRDHLGSTRSHRTGRESFNYVMMYFANMADNGLVILPTHRLVREFPRIPFQKLEEALQRYFYLEPYPKTPEGQRWFLRGLKRGGKRLRLMGASFKGDPRYLILRLKNKRSMQRLAKEMSAPLRELDVTALHLLILEHILGVTSEEQAKSDVIRYLRDEEEALKAVEKGEHMAAFILNPPRPEEIRNIALGGETMPQKSTYFYPKVLSGLVINKIDPEEEIEGEPQP
jgi:uncharacterized protein (DUF1015 family)